MIWRLRNSCHNMVDQMDHTESQRHGALILQCVSLRVSVTPCELLRRVSFCREIFCSRKLDSVGTIVSRFSILPISAIVEIAHILKSTLPKGRFVDVGIKLSLKLNVLRLHRRSSGRAACD